MHKRMLSWILTLSLILGISCSYPLPKNELKVAASAVPHAELLEFVRPDLASQGIDLRIIITDDYNMPNRALAQEEIDANFFQHIPFFDEQVKYFGYPIETLAKIEIEPMGIYSKKVHALSTLKDKATIGIPNDPTNEARALLLLQEQGLIQLDNPHNLKATIVNIKENPKHLQFIEVDAAMLPRALDDVDAVAINTNYALQAGLSPLKDALALENKDSPYVNIIAVRKGDENRPAIQALKAAMTSENMRLHIQDKYKGAIIPAF